MLSRVKQPLVQPSSVSKEECFCIDYQRLNALTQKDVYPLPRIDDLLDQLDGKKVFSTLDAHSGYWQIRMHEASQEKMAFTTSTGRYEFRVLPFGLCNTPATFQRLMQKVLAGLGGSEPFCSVYIDDIQWTPDITNLESQQIRSLYPKICYIRCFLFYTLLYQKFVISEFVISGVHCTCLF